MSLREPQIETSPHSREQERAPRRSFLRDNLVTLVAMTIAVALAAFIWFALPREREVGSVGMLLFKLTPFAAASIAVAWLDLDWARRLRLPQLVIPACFLVFFCYFVPRNFFLAEDPARADTLYYNMLTAVPFMILALVTAYRLGGGSRGTVLRLSTALILLQLSGLEDLAYATVNPHTDPEWTTIPEVWDWASHMTVRLGHPATKNEAFAFIALHVVLALAVLFVPGRRRRD